MSLQSFVQRKAFYTKSFYIKVLFSFVVIILLTVLSTSLIFSAPYMGNIYTQLTKDSFSTIERLKGEFDNVFKQISDMNLYLTRIPDINTFLYSNVMDDYMALNRADISSRQIWNLNPYLYSIILYNKSAGINLMSGKLNVDRDHLLNGRLESPDAKGSLNLVFSYVIPDNPDAGKQTETLSVLFNQSDTADTAGDNGIIITLDRDEIGKKLLGSIEGMTMAADEKGRIIFSSSVDTIGGSISGLDYFKRVTASGNQEGSLVMKIDNTNEIVSFAKSSRTGFYLINIRSAGTYTDVIVKDQVTILVISITLLLIFLLAGYIVSKKLYSPIKKVTEQLSDSQFGDKQNFPGDISIITSAFNKALAHIGELETISADNNEKLKEEYLRRFLKADKLTDAIKKEKDGFRISLDFTCLFLICIRIDNYIAIEWNKRLAYETTLSGTIPEMLGSGFLCETVNMYDGEIALLLNVKKDDRYDLPEVISVMDNLRDFTRQTFGFTMTVGIGGYAGSMDDCSGLYKKAVDMAKHKFVLGPDHTIHQKLLEDTLTAVTHYPSEMQDKLIKAIKLNKKDYFIEVLSGIVELLRHYTYSESMSVLFQIITECIKTINQTVKQGSSRYYLDLGNISSMFNSLETLNQAEEWLISIFDDYRDILEKISQMRNSKHYSLVEKMLEYIKQHYRNPDINVESLAEKAGYTSYYFSKIFREVTGLNVLDYIKQLRINRAKELLCMEEMKVSEIPDLVGFTNSGYFYYTFKRDVGLTPSAYREHALSSRTSVNGT